jgi:hypothetical protein
MTPPKMLAYCDARNDNRSMRTTRCGLKSFTTAKTHMRPLRAYFAGWPAIRVAYKTAEEYAKKRLALGKKPATVNRELELLRRALRLAHDRGQLPAVPKIRLSEVVCGAALPKGMVAPTGRNQSCIIEVRDFIAR